MGIFDVIGKGKKENPKDLWEQFFKAVMKYEWKKALDLLTHLKSLEPDNAQVHIKLGDILQRTGDKSGAVTAYHKAADNLMTMFNTQKALAIYKVIIRLNPKDESAKQKMQEILEELNMVEASSDFGDDAPQEEFASIEAPVESVEIARPSPAEEEPEAAPEPAAAQAPAQSPTQASAEPQPKKAHSLREAFASHPLFSVLGNETIVSINKKASHRKYFDRKIVIKEDEPGDSIFIITAGKAMVTSRILEKTYKLATLSQWDFFGEAGFLTGMPRTATVSAIGPLSVMEISKELLNEIIEENPLVLKRLVETSQSRAQSTMSKLRGGKKE